MTNNYDELKKLAEAATPGVWTRDKTSALDADVRALHAEFPHKGYPVALCWGLWKPGSKETEAKRKAQANANAAYIAAANPAVIKELLSELTALRAAASAPKAELPGATQQDMELVIARLEQIASGAAADVREAAEQALPCARAVLAQAAPVADERPGLERAAKYLEKQADDYLSEHASTEHDTGAVSFHFGEAGRSHHALLGELAEELRALAPAAPVAAAVPAGWVSVDERLPECDMKPGSLGVEVLIYPQFERGEHTAFFGCRCTDYPSFYKHGVVLGAVTHWQALPAAPAPGASK